jgi:catalase (peroxidase I)
MTPDMVGGNAYYGAILSTLAYQCASTFRVTDYLGGCNGARIRSTEALSWPVNVDLDKALALLQPIKDNFGDSLSWADLIVYAGQVANEQAGGISMTMCGGRSDAPNDGNDGGWSYLTPRGNYSLDVTSEFRDLFTVMGLTSREAVALQAQLRSPSLMVARGYSGSWTDATNVLSNAYFTALLNSQWSPTSPTGEEYMSGIYYMTQNDMIIRGDAELLSIAQEFANNETTFLNDFASAWTKLMNSDRFDGPSANLCDVPPPTPPPPAPVNNNEEIWIGVGSAVGGILVGVLAACLVTKNSNKDGFQKDVI